MALARDDRFVADALGRALSGAQVYWCLQPASTSANPPSPLAPIYSDNDGTPETQPVLADGFGHSWAYLDNSLLYTVVIWHPLFGSNPIVLPDQSIGGGGGGGSSSLNPFSGVPIGTQDGSNTIFTLANGVLPLGVPPVYVDVWNNFPLINGLGYSIAGVTLTFATAPGPSDNIFAQGFFSS